MKFSMFKKPIFEKQCSLAVIHQSVRRLNYRLDKLMLNNKGKFLAAYTARTNEIKDQTQRIITSTGSEGKSVAPQVNTKSVLVGKHSVVLK